MTSDPKLDPLERDLERVRAAFRAAEFDDEPPPAVDAAIRAAAANARGRRLHGYLPPLALAATVVLALGLVLRLAVPTQDPADVSLLRDADDAPGTRAVESLSSQATTGETAPARRERAAAPERSSAADDATPAPSPALPQAAPEAAAEFSRTPSAAAATDSAGEEPAARGAIESLAAPAAGCETARRADADGWLACIAALLDAGNAAAARAEVEAFTASYPERAVPATITERLVP